MNSPYLNRCRNPTDDCSKFKKFVVLEWTYNFFGPVMIDGPEKLKWMNGTKNKKIGQDQ